MKLYDCGIQKIAETKTILITWNLKDTAKPRKLQGNPELKKDGKI